MEILIQLESNGSKKEVQLKVNRVQELLNSLHDFTPAAITNVQIALIDKSKKVFGCRVEICGLTAELLLKTCRFYFVEMAWEQLQIIKPKLASYQEHKAPLKQELSELYHCCQVVFMSDQPTAATLDEQVDYLQSLEDAIRCGQVTFVEHLTDTNINRERLATLLVASMFESAKNVQDYKRLEDAVQIVIPEFALGNGDASEALYDGLERMIGYVNSICD